MREIKFRAWCRLSNCDEGDIEVMTEPFDLPYLMDNYNQWKFTDGGYLRFHEMPLDDNITLMQYTGLKDKNGREIYEGDVVRYYYHVSKPDNDFYGVIEYHVLVGFILRCKKRDGSYFYTNIPDIEDIEVIGNIYENPELLEDK